MSGIERRKNVFASIDKFTIRDCKTVLYRSGTSGVAVAKSTIRTLLLLPNVIKSDVYFNWTLVRGDADDNKFVDCAIAANADYIVTHDRHFNVLNEIDFPVVNVVNIHQFQTLLADK